MEICSNVHQINEENSEDNLNQINLSEVQKEREKTPQPVHEIKKSDEEEILPKESQESFH
jgi:hypothetical protein